MSGRASTVFSTVSGFLLAHAASALGCAVCLTGADDAITEGYNASVLFLMATPYVVGSSIAAGLIFAYRRASRRRHVEEDSTMELGWNQEESGR